jgi:hypothetical protein
MVSIGAGVVVDEIARQHAIDHDREFAGCGGDGFGLSGPHRQAAINAPRAVEVLPRSSRSGAELASPPTLSMRAATCAPAQSP